MFLGLIRASHLGPTLAVTAVTLILGVAVGLEGLRLALVGLAMLAGQLSIGWSNDWIDVERDRSVKRTDKPVAAGSVSEVAVRNAAAVAVLLMIPLSFAVGFWAGVANIVSVAAGWSYNIWLKRTIFSGVPYVIAFGLLPLFVTQSLPAPLLAAPWAIAAGALLGFAAHFANVLPDLLDDADTGVRGLPHVLGRVGSGVVAFAALLLASLFVVAGPLLAGLGASAATGAGLLLNVGIGVVGLILVFSRPPTRLLFQLIIASALIDVVLLALAGAGIAVG